MGYNTYRSRVRSATVRLTPFRCGGRISTRCFTNMHANAEPMHARATKSSISSRVVRANVARRRTDNGRSYWVQARYLVDASGRDALLTSKRS